jgi:hypothetical protein
MWAKAATLKGGATPATAKPGGGRLRPYKFNGGGEQGTHGIKGEGAQPGMAVLREAECGGVEVVVGHSCFCRDAF